MGKSGRVRLVDIRRSMRLVSDCRDVGDDPPAWAAVLAEGIRGLVDAQVVTVAPMELEAGGRPPRTVVLADRGWASPAHREHWLRSYVLIEQFREVPTFARLMAILDRRTTRTREQLIDDAAWYASAEFNEFHRPMELDDLLVSFGRLDAAPVVFTLGITRPLGARRFDARERRLTRVLHFELSGVLGRSIALDSRGPWPDLQPRLRRALECLLEGDTLGQAALRLGLSRNTVHEYASLIYRHFGVRSRAELLARCARLKGRAGGPPA